MNYTLLMHVSQQKAYTAGRWLVEQGANIRLKMKNGSDAINLTYFAGEFAMASYTVEALDFAAFLEAKLKGH